MSTVDFSDPARKRVHYRGQGNGSITIDYWANDEETESHRFVIPFEFLHSPDGPVFSLEEDEFRYEGPGDYTSLPSEVKDIATSSETRREASRKANY